MKTEHNAANKFEAMNTLAIPFVTNSFSIINWKFNDRRRMHAKTRKMLTTSEIHHPKSDVDRLYFPRTAGGRVQLKLSHKNMTTIGLNAYLTSNNDPLLQIVKNTIRKKLYSEKK